MKNIAVSLTNPFFQFFVYRENLVILFMSSENRRVMKEITTGKFHSTVHGMSSFTCENEVFFTFKFKIKFESKYLDSKYYKFFGIQTRIFQRMNFMGKNA